MNFKERIYSALERPISRLVFRFVGFILIAGLLGGLGVFFKDVLQGGNLQDYASPKIYGAALTWLVFLLIWLFIKRTHDEYKKFINICIIRSVPAIPDRLDFDPKKWNSGFNSHFDHEFTKWELTEAEKEVGLLLLTGMSQEEIAKFRSTTLKTVKNQSTVIYEKAQVKNGKELMSYFIQKLLPATNEI